MRRSSRLISSALLLGAALLPGLSEAQPRPAYRGMSCRAELGPRGASYLLSQCLAVSPGHPACSTTNTCATIAGEIRRGCLDADDDDKYPFCASYNVDRDDD